MPKSIVQPVKMSTWSDMFKDGEMQQTIETTTGNRIVVEYTYDQLRLELETFAAKLQQYVDRYVAPAEDGA